MNQNILNINNNDGAEQKFQGFDENKSNPVLDLFSPILTNEYYQQRIAERNQRIGNNLKVANRENQPNGSVWLTQNGLNTLPRGAYGIDGTYKALPDISNISRSDLYTRGFPNETPGIYNISRTRRGNYFGYRFKGEFFFNNRNIQSGIPGVYTTENVRMEQAAHVANNFESTAGTLIKTGPVPGERYRRFDLSANAIVLNI